MKSSNSDSPDVSGRNSGADKTLPSSSAHRSRDYPHGAVVAVVWESGKLLTIKRSALVKAPGMIGFAGGGVEPGEQPVDAIVREMREELNVAVDPLAHIWTGKTPSGIPLRFFHVAIQAGQILCPEPAEVESFAWYRPTELRQVPNLLSSAIDFLDHWEAGKIRLDV